MLESLRRLIIPLGWGVQALVVDNASTDSTAEIVREISIANIEVRYTYEPRRGKSHALNRAAGETQSDYLLFLDDDVFPSANWLRQMVQPLLDGTCDAVNGNLILAPDLNRPWFDRLHLLWLAISLDAQSRDWSRELIGANCGFCRSVLAKVSGWEPSLGPGPDGVGYCEDTYLGRQLAAAGCKIDYLPAAIAVHCVDPERLKRRAWLNEARKRGRSEAYILHQFERIQIVAPRLKHLWYMLKISTRRIVQPPPPLEAEGCPPWEMSYVARLAKYRYFIDLHRSWMFPFRYPTMATNPPSRALSKPLPPRPTDISPA